MLLRAHYVVNFSMICGSGKKHIFLLDCKLGFYSIPWWIQNEKQKTEKGC